MRKGRLIRSVAVSLATLGLCLPSVVFAAPAPATPPVVDIAMADGGVLHGQVVDLQKGGAAGMPVTVRTQNNEVAKTTTQKDGRFTIQGLRGGVYQVAAGQGQGVFRVWTANAAPPSAQPRAIVYTQNVDNGNSGGLKTFLANPIVIAGIVATAIAVPVALANSHSASP
jgi:hypothetical protein